MVSMYRRRVWMTSAAAALAPIGNQWSSGGGQVWPLDQRMVASAAGVNSNRSGLGQLVLIAVAVAAVGAFTVLQLRAWSRRRRSSSGRSRDTYDWRTLPPPLQDDDPGPGEMPFGQQESYGPLWRYGAPRGYRGDYEPGCEPARGPGYARDSDAGAGPGDRPGSGPGYDPDFGPGYDPGFGPGARLPWRVPGDVPRVTGDRDGRSPRRPS